MARKLVGWNAHTLRALFDDAGDYLVGDAIGHHLPVSEGAENRSLSDAGGRDPLAIRTHGAGFRITAVGNTQLAAFALLIGLGAPDQDLQPFVAVFDVAEIQRRQLRAAKTAG